MGQPIEKNVSHPFMTMILTCVTVVAWADVPDNDRGDFRRWCRRHIYCIDIVVVSIETMKQSLFGFNAVQELFHSLYTSAHGERTAKVEWRLYCCSAKFELNKIVS